MIKFNNLKLQFLECAKQSFVELGWGVDEGSCDVSIGSVSVLADDVADGCVSWRPSCVSVPLTVDSILLSDRVPLTLTTLLLRDGRSGMITEWIWDLSLLSYWWCLSKVWWKYWLTDPVSADIRWVVQRERSKAQGSYRIYSCISRKILDKIRIFFFNSTYTRAVEKRLDSNFESKSLNNKFIYRVRLKNQPIDHKVDNFHVLTKVPPNTRET